MKTFFIVISIVAVVGLPFLFQRSEKTIGDTEDVVVVITPHNEAIRFEFETAFRNWYTERTGRTVDVDWRVIGGTSEIVRYISSEYENSFRNYWTGDLGRKWTSEARQGYSDRKLELEENPQEEDESQQARRAFLDSDISVGIDIFFGGGSYDFGRQAAIGSLVPWRDEAELRERFPDDLFPQTFAGEVFWDDQGRWIGAVLSSFGIIYNRNSLLGLGIDEMPVTWADLADPRLIGQVALADPTKSGSITKAFEMIVQDCMGIQVARLISEGLTTEEAEAKGVPLGWMDAMEMIQLISANARYFTDSATKGPMDVASGDSAVGMSIDFYGRYQSEIIISRGGGDRLHYVTPAGASTLSADPIGLLRGAPNPEVADLFMEFVLSEAGQRLWGYRVGVENGPIEYALRRSPAFRSLYEGESRKSLSEPEVNPYEEVGDFVYRPDWTGRLFTPLRFLIRVAFIDPHEELVAAWEGIQEAEKRGDSEAAAKAKKIFSNLEAIDYMQATGPISEVLGGGDKIDEVRLARTIADGFREQYREALRVSKGSR